MDIDDEIEYESPAIIDYGDLAVITAGQLHDPIDGHHGGPHVDPHLTFSA